MTKKKQFCPRGHDTFQVGRDASKKCLQCKAEDAAARAALQEQALAEANAAFERRQAEMDRRFEREYQRAIQAGGDVAAEARWQRLYDEMIDAGSRFGLCQWDLDNGQPGACTRRTRGVYCHVHSRQVERERRRARVAAEESPDRSRNLPV